MLSAVNELRETVVAWETTREDGPFFCPECKEEVILKKGSTLLHHFAHYPESYCSYGTGESEQHHQAKKEVYEALRIHPGVSDLIVEEHLKEVRPDVSFLWQGKWKVAIEMQISDLSPEKIAYRTRCYAAKNIWVLWTIPYDKNTMSCLTPHRTKVREQYLHALYFGKVYYWLGGIRLLPIHFKPHVMDSSLELCYDYNERKIMPRLKHKYSPVLRDLDPSEVVNITDLQPIKRKAVLLGKFDLPNALLWSIPGNQGKHIQGPQSPSTNKTEGGN